MDSVRSLRLHRPLLLTIAMGQSPGQPQQPCRSLPAQPSLGCTPIPLETQLPKTKILSSAIQPRQLRISAALTDATGQCEVTSVAPPTATDNCDGLITGTTIATFPITSNTTITWTYSDSAGNSTTQDQNVVIGDTTAPAEDVAVLGNVTGQCEVTSVAPPTATDNCDGLITGTTTATFPITSSATITWTYIDSAGNSTTQDQNIVIGDTTAPAEDVAVLGDVTGQCEVTSIAPPTATDNCDGAITGTTTTTFPITAITTITWTYIDSAGNLTTQDQNIVIGDTTAPMADSATLADVNGQCEVTSVAPPTATDNCDGAITGTTIATFPITSNATITWTYTDSAGNSTTQDQNVAIGDTTAPAEDVAVLGNVTGQCEVTSIAPPTATDNCDGAITGTTIATFPITASTTITWTYTDSAGNSTTQDQNVAIGDTTAPAEDVAVLGDVTGQCEVTSIAPPTATDNCDGAITGTTTATFPITSSTTIIWTYIDSAGNANTQDQNVVIGDTTAPAEDVAVLGNVTGQCEVTSVAPPTATDNCDGLITGTTTATFPITSSTTIIWTYIDSAGNSTTQDQNVVIGDTTAPMADSATLADVTGQCEVTSVAPPTAADNCDGTITGTTTATLPITANTTITWTYIDSAGNSTTQDQNIVIGDTTTPAADVAMLADVAGQCEVTSVAPPTATDNCDGTITGTTTATLPITASTTITWMYTDSAGNSTTQDQNVAIGDTTAPAEDVAVLGNVTGQCEVTSIAPPTATDNCDGAITGTTIATFPITASTTITWTYTDSAGNSTTQDQNIVIGDTTAPIADSAALTDATGQCEVTSVAPPTATDNCDGAITGTTTATFPITAITTITWTYIDSAGNSTTQDQNIVIGDTTAPVADSAALTDATGQCEVTSVAPPTATDNCDGAITGTTTATFPITSSATITWTYIDSAGNSTTQDQNIVIGDTTAPIADSAALTDATGQCEVTSVAPPTATDNCDGAITGTTTATFPITAITTITWTYIDSAGNSTTQDQNIVIGDTTAPMADSATLADVNGQCEVTSVAPPTATDNCDGAITGTTIATFPITSNATITWTYTDSAGNSTTQDQKIIVGNPPRIDPIADVNQCAPFDLPAITGSDLSGNELYYDQPNGSASGGNSYMAGISFAFADFSSYPVTLYAYDESGSCSSEVSFEFTLQDCNLSVAATANQNSICSADNTTVTLTATPDPAAPVGTYSYSWNELGNTTVLSTNQTLDVTPTTTNDYEVMIIDSGLSAPNNMASSTVTITVIASPIADVLANVQECDSFTLPALTSGSYFDAPNGGGTMLNAGDAISSTQTIYVFAESGTTPNCTDESQFTVTIIDSPTVDDPADLVACNSYTLPALTNGNYFTGSGGTGRPYVGGEVLTNTTSMFVYAETGTTPNCAAENNFLISIIPGSQIDAISDVDQCAPFALPAITGTDLSGNQTYYDLPSGPAGGGNTYAVGTSLTFADFANYPVTLYAYDEDGSCSSEIPFELTLQDCNLSVTAMASQSAICSADNTTVTLTATPDPAAAIGIYSFSWNELGNATVLGTNSTLDVTPSVTTDYEVTIVDSGLSAPNDTASSTIAVTIIASPVADVLADLTQCDSYILPVLTSGNYFDAPNGGGTMLNAGNTVSSSQTIYVFAESGSTPNCTDESQFTVTIIDSPTADVLANVDVCDSFTLPALSNGQYFTQSNGAGTQLNAGDVITSDQTVYVFAQSGTTPNCTDESSFTISITDSPQMDPIADVTECAPYVLPVITGSNLSGNETYYDLPGGSSGGGTAFPAGSSLAFADFTSYPVTLYAFDQNASCPVEVSFNLTLLDCTLSVTGTASMENLCDNDLMMVTLTATPDPMTAVGNYSYVWVEQGTTAVLGTNPNLDVDPTVTSIYEVTVTDSGLSAGNNSSTTTVTITVNAAPTADAPADVTACDSYILPVLNSGNYFTSPDGGGTPLTAGDAVSVSQTVYVFAENITTPICTDESSFTVTIIDSPMADDPADVTACDNYTLPVLTVGEYFTQSNGAGIQLNAGDVITMSQTVYVFAQSGTTPNCTDENAFAITISASPQLDPIADLTVCSPFFLPVINGIGLSGGQRYYTNSGGSGTSFAGGDQVLISDFASYPVTLYAYDVNGICPAESSFDLTLLDCSLSVDATANSDSLCDNALSTVTLTATPNPAAAQGSYSYSWNELGNTAVLGTNQTLDVNPNVTTTYEVSIIDSGLPSSSNTASDTVTVTIINAPVADVLADVVECDSTTLPAISSGNYFTASGGTGTALAAGDAITSSQVIFIYAETGTTPNCSDESSFNILIDTTPVADAPADVTSCDNYTLPALTTGDYFTQSGGSGTQLNAGDVINISQTLFVYAVNAGNNSCSSENSFSITITSSPQVDVLADMADCDMFVLPNLMVGDYFTQTGGTGTPLTAGDVITVTQTIFIYASNGGGIVSCEDESSFTVTIFNTPQLDTPADVDACDSFVLPAITGSNLSGNEAYFTQPNGTGSAYNAGDAINFADFASYPVTLFVYDETATTPNCSDESSFAFTITQSPDIDPQADLGGCDTVTLPVITGINLTGGQMYYTAPGGGGVAFAEADTIQFTDFTTYPVTFYIYDSSSTTTVCEDEVSFQLTIEPTPVLDAVADVEECEFFILPAISGNNLTGNQAYFRGTGGNGRQFNPGDTVTVSDFATYPVTLYAFDSTGNPFNCADEVSFELILNPNPAAIDIGLQEYCDDDEDGRELIDLSLLDGMIADFAPDVVVTYYDLLTDAENSINPLSSEINVPLGNRDLVARVDDINTGCFSIVDLALRVNEIPVAMLEEMYLLCQDQEGNITGAPILDTGLTSPDFVFEWFLDQGNGDVLLASETGGSLEAMQAGVYTVVVTDPITECSNVLVSTVEARIDPFAFGAENSGNNMLNQHEISVFVASNNTSTRYEVRLDDGFWIELINSNRRYNFTFKNVLTGNGIHTVQFRSTDGCWEAEKKVRTVGVPLYFTPNGDGFNDRWNVEGILEIDPNAKVEIYDRYGKLIGQISVSGAGWDGMIRGNFINETDYWYRMIYMDKDENGNLLGEQELKGHFALKR